MPNHSAVVIDSFAVLSFYPRSAPTRPLVASAVGKWDTTSSPAISPGHQRPDVSLETSRPTNTPGPTLIRSVLLHLQRHLLRATATITVIRSLPTNRSSPPLASSSAAPSQRPITRRVEGECLWWQSNVNQLLYIREPCYHNDYISNKHINWLLNVPYLT